MTQVGFLRLMTTAAAMAGKPLTMAEAWRVHDRLFEDDRVAFVPEPAEVDTRFPRTCVRPNGFTETLGRRLATGFRTCRRGKADHFRPGAGRPRRPAA